MLVVRSDGRRPQNAQLSEENASISLPLLLGRRVDKRLFLPELGHSDDSAVWYLYIHMSDLTAINGAIHVGHQCCR